MGAIMQETVTDLEKLLSGEIQSLEVVLSGSMNRDKLIEALNHLMGTFLPGCWVEGEFINKDSSDYMIYDLHLAGAISQKTFSSIRLLEFDDRFKLIRT